VRLRHGHRRFPKARRSCDVGRVAEQWYTARQTIRADIDGGYAMWPLLLATVILLASTAPSLGSEAPFGLSWGMSIEQAQQGGLQGSVAVDNEDFTVFQALRLPSHPVDTESAVLVFGTVEGLQRVDWYSKRSPGDRTGSKAKDIYFQIRNRLIEKYGEPTRSDEGIPISYYNRFYECVETPGCGGYAVTWSRGDLSIILQIEGRGSHSEGWVYIDYRGPDWASLLIRYSESAERGNESF